MLQTLCDFTEKMSELYQLLEDEQSKALFWARLQFEVNSDMDGAMRLVQLSGVDPFSDYTKDWRKVFAAAASADRRIVLYGAGAMGKTYAEMIIKSGLDFYAFCDRNKFGSSVMSKPVLSPEEVASHPQQYCIIIDTDASGQEIIEYFVQRNFPRENILNYYDITDELRLREKEYFEFPQCYRRGTAFIDAGCLDGTDSIRFARWCGGGYSEIYAFEPDRYNYVRCDERLQSAGIRNIHLLSAALGNFSGEGTFYPAANGGSYLKIGNSEKYAFQRPVVMASAVRVEFLDEIVKQPVGMIKMDIEGAELEALMGARRILKEDKPFLAISAYHKTGDLLGIMDFLHTVEPKYSFRLRHYGPVCFETILYASVDGF